MTKPDYWKEGLWMLVPLKFESPKLCGWILSWLHFFLILKSRSHGQHKTQKSDLVTLLPLLKFWNIMIRAQIIEFWPIISSTCMSKSFKKNQIYQLWQKFPSPSKCHEDSKVSKPLRCFWNITSCANKRDLCPSPVISNQSWYSSSDLQDKT